MELFLLIITLVVMFSVALVCLSFDLFKRNIIQKVMNMLQWNFMEGSGVVQGQLIKFWWQLESL